LSAWFAILGQSGRRGSKIVFVDGFSGKGSFSDGSDGSPLVALRSILEHSNLPTIRTQIELIFIEINPGSAATLKSKLDDVYNSIENVFREKGENDHKHCAV
jgi:three-Cys-motif partner protein